MSKIIVASRNDRALFEWQSRRERVAISHDSECKSAGSACYIHSDHNRKVVENCKSFFFLLTFSSCFFKEEKVRIVFKKCFLKCTFLSLYLRGKEKEKYQKKEKTRHSFLRSYERE